MSEKEKNSRHGTVAEGLKLDSCTSVLTFVGLSYNFMLVQHAKTGRFEKYLKSDAA